MVYSIKGSSIPVPWSHLFSKLKHAFVLRGLNYMGWHICDIRSFAFRKWSRWLLAFCWIVGLGLGVLTFRHTGEYTVATMYLRKWDQVSIISLFSCALLPFLFSAFAVYLHRPGLLLIICLVRAFLYGYVLLSVCSAFSGAGWLLRWLLLFTDSCTAALFFGYSWRHIHDTFGYFAAGFGFCTAAVAMIVGVDYKFILPFLRQLLSR